MKRLQWLLLFLLILCNSSYSRAQAWSGILDPTRATDWSGVGIPGGIPTRSTICSTLTSTATTATINAAIQACPSGQVVFLSAGSYSIAGGITFNGVSNVTLRGAGPAQTILNFTGGDGCGGLKADVCVIDTSRLYSASAATQPGGANACSWTSGYSQGTTSITLTSCGSTPPVNQFIIFDQANDTSDNRGLFICDIASTCRINGGNNEDGRIIGGVTYSSQQLVYITAVSGSGSGPYTVTISPGLYANNWRSGQSPGAWWPGQVTLDGIENLTVNSSGVADPGITFYDCYKCWVKNVRQIKSMRAAVELFQSARVVVRDSYFYLTQNSAQESYGVEFNESSDDLVENNIFDGITAPFLFQVGQGVVIAYNYTLNNPFSPSPTYMQDATYHNAGSQMDLWEGNDTDGITSDDTWGSSAVSTFFRNHVIGWMSGKTLQTYPIDLDYFSRGYNIIGNVLGQPAYHNNYEASVNTSSTNCNSSIYELGYQGGTCTGSTDALVHTTLLRWGNYDVAHASVQWNASEIPTTGVPFINGNPVPATHNLPSSLYLTTKPIWWGSMPWPAIGPDVTGGTGPGGFAYTIPAQVCYDNTAKDSNGALIFDANACYYSQQRPAPPTNLKSVVN